jgi:very-short-patch-repair endonuclease
MRLLLFWLVWLILAALALLSPSWLFPAVAITISVALVALIIASLRWLWLRAQVSVSEHRIRERDSTTESPLERMLASELDRRGIAYKREHRVSRTSIDFAFPASMLAVECDGWRYHNSPAQRQRDARRDEFLRIKGWRVMRIAGSEIRRDTGACVQKIIDAL